jgi:hypothetical protein
VALGITALAVGFGLLAGAISVAAAAEGGMMALMPGFITSLYGAASGFMAISIAGAPLWAIVAAVAAIAFAVYEVGKAFGWWCGHGDLRGLPDNHQFSRNQIVVRFGVGQCCPNTTQLSVSCFDVDVGPAIPHLSLARRRP